MDLMRVEKLGFVRNGMNILKDVSFKLNPGSFKIILGPNGAGKSSLLRFMSGLHQPLKGKVFFDGIETSVWSLKELAKRRAVLSQLQQIPLDLTGKQLVLMGRFAHYGSESKETSWSICEKSMQLTGTLHLASRSVNSLSGGERQRLQLARVLAQVDRYQDESPRLILLDEPLNALDIKHQIEILQLVREKCNQGDGAVAILHDINLAIQFADNIVFMKNGQIMAEGRPLEIIESELLQKVYDLPMEVIEHVFGITVMPGTSSFFGAIQKAERMTFRSF